MLYNDVINLTIGKEYNAYGLMLQWSPDKDEPTLNDLLHDAVKGLALVCAFIYFWLIRYPILEWEMQLEQDMLEDGQSTSEREYLVDVALELGLRTARFTKSTHLRYYINNSEGIYNPVILPLMYINQTLE